MECSREVSGTGHFDLAVRGGLVVVDGTAPQTSAATWTLCVTAS